MVKILKELQDAAEPYKFGDLVKECDRELKMRTEVYGINMSPQRESQFKKMERIRKILQVLDVAHLGGEQKELF
jgi:hypothetical protein